MSHIGATAPDVAELARTLVSSQQFAGKRSLTVWERTLLNRRPIQAPVPSVATGAVCLASSDRFFNVANTLVRASNSDSDLSRIVNAPMLNAQEYALEQSLASKVVRTGSLSHVPRLPSSRATDEGLEKLYLELFRTLAAINEKKVVDNVSHVVCTNIRNS